MYTVYLTSYKSYFLEEIPKFINNDYYSLDPIFKIKDLPYTRKQKYIIKTFFFSEILPPAKGCTLGGIDYYISDIKEGGIKC